MKRDFSFFIRARSAILDEVREERFMGGMARQRFLDSKRTIIFYKHIFMYLIKRD
jgi:hypothetical protein